MIFSKDVIAPAVADVKDSIRKITWNGTHNEILIVFGVYVHLESDSIYAMVAIGRIPPLSWALDRLRYLWPPQSLLSLHYLLN